MKTKSKALLLSLCAVLLVAATVFGTMAYLTSTTNTVVNTFTVGSVNITLDEKKVDLNGVPVTPEERISGVNNEGFTNQYKLMPGHTYTKDPTVHVTSGSEDCYIRMFVTIENWTTLATKLPEGYLPEQLCDWNSAYWTNEDYNIQGNNAVLEFRHNAIVKDTDTIPALFNSITLPGEVDDLTGLDTVKINVTAEAIQADSFTDATAAFTALTAAK